MIASTVGALLARMLTVAEADAPVVSVAVKRKLSAPPDVGPSSVGAGKVKVVLVEVVLLSIISGPDICCQR